MRKILEILRLRFEVGRSYREIADSVNCGSSSVGECLQRFNLQDLAGHDKTEFRKPSLRIFSTLLLFREVALDILPTGSTSSKS